MSGNPLYPRGFMTPEGRAYTIRQMAHALRKCRANPMAEVRGWEWYTVPAWHVIHEFQRGLDWRINMRGARK